MKLATAYDRVIFEGEKVLVNLISKCRCKNLDSKAQEVPNVVVERPLMRLMDVTRGYDWEY